MTQRCLIPKMLLNFSDRTTLAHCVHERKMLDDEDAYRARKEGSVAGLTGTSMAEILLFSTPIPVGLWLLGEAKVRQQS